MEERTSQLVALDFDPDNSRDGDSDPPPKKPGSKGPGRKRTKTGCLTCRKRRIKCGEERPTCQNCIKSKRHCEGYNQRVIFKDPLNAYRPSLSTPVQVSFTKPIVGYPARHGKKAQQASAAANSHAIAPKPLPSFGASMRGPDAATMLHPARRGSERKYYPFSDKNGRKSHKTQSSSSKHQVLVDIPPDVIDHPRLPEPWQGHKPEGQAVHYDFESLMQPGSAGAEMYPAQKSPFDWSTKPSTLLPSYQASATTTWMPLNAPYPTENAYIPRPPTETAGIIDIADAPDKNYKLYSGTQSGSQQNIDIHIPHAVESRPTLKSIDAGHQISWEEDGEDLLDISDDDLVMGEHDDTEAWQEDVRDDHLGTNDLGIMVALRASQDDHGIGLRSYRSFIDRPNMLATYIPSPQTTPLSDRTAAMIFCHFVNVTGPSMSIFERHPANPSLIFQGAPIPRSQQHIWAYTFPTLALQNPALLHAMLALASLHIAKLQGGPITASLKHYAIGIRRVGKSVSLPTRRGHPATLAAALLLAFYECWSADHQKWSNHLLGARQLVREIDFVGMTRFIKRRKAQQRNEEARRYQQSFFDGENSAFDYNGRFSPQAEEVDENLVGMLMGKKVRYDQYGQIIEDFVSMKDWNKTYTERDLEIYETQRDLFWWYCKQDVYQSILGGGKLFLDYSSWSHCPPRAPLGRLNAVYGTFDHLILLMGRVTDFAARDMKRKRAVIKANGGWRPPAAPGQSSEMGASESSPQTPPPMPSFSGMVPGFKEAQLPMGFEPSRDASPQSVQSDDNDLPTQTIEAEEEWQEIYATLTILEDHFGEDFQALGPEFSAPIDTPFGPALQYRTYSIAGLWMNYYMGLIFCHRSHPSMPPASMVAAGIMRTRTEYYANQLGRIAAGVAPDCNRATEVNPGVGAALIESATCLFIAGIQYHDQMQRTWTVDRLHHIARLTGWQTALAIASGCEASWMKTHEIGKGPPYVRISDDMSQSIYPTTRRIDRLFVGKSSEDGRIAIDRPERVHYALGVLGLEEDFQSLDITKA